MLTEGCRGKITLSAGVAAHDDSLLDIIVSCDGCSRQLNHFLGFDEMMELD